MQMIGTILIVDDEPFVRATIEALLGRDYRLVCADDGPTALEIAQNLTPDVILLDVMMPGMDGFEVCRRLRATPALAAAPIILITALDDRNSRLRGIEAGADEFITKPFDPIELRARVRTIIQLNRYRQLMTERLRFRWVIDQADDGYLIVNDQDMICYANPQARIYLDLLADQDEAPTVSFLEQARRQYHCEPENTWANWPNLLSPDHTEPRYLVRPESPSASMFWLQIDLFELPDATDVCRIVRLRDVTAHMTLHRNIWEFHSIISHKLRTPLVSMIGGLQLLAQRVSHYSDERLAEATGIMLRGGQRLQDEVTDILQYLYATRLAQPGASFAPAQFQALVAEISASLGLESVTVVDHADLHDAQVGLAQQAIELIMWEILENARKFHPRQAPTIEIMVLHPRPDAICIRICDDGVTLAPDQLVHAWTPYYQGEKFFTGQVNGMGLGLAMVSTLVWGVGGTRRLINREPGPGIIVELTLPLSLQNGKGTADSHALPISDQPLFAQNDATHASLKKQIARPARRIPGHRCCGS